ncbi:WD40-repeat-containing domain protein [Mycena epipterygia]|nr:WD40-repeat-containing domain protein [Mycena epipterygia]
MSQGYKLLVQSADGVEWKPSPLHHKRPNLYVVIYQDGAEVQRTHKVKRDLAPKWEYLSKISADVPSSTISLRLFHDSSLPFVGDECLGVVDTDISALLEHCGSDGAKKVVKLELKDIDGKPVGSISVRLIRDVEAGALAIDMAQKDMEDIGLGAKSSVFMKGGGIVAHSASTVKDYTSALGILTSKLEIIVSIGDQIAMIHPYAKIAWKVLTSVYRAAKKQQETDEQLFKLVETMVDVYSFVEDVESLPQKIKSLEDKALAIVQQTVESALFIQEYTANGFCDRAVRNTWNHAERKIDELCAAFLKLKDSFDGRLKMESFFVSMKILDGVERLDQSDTLKKLNPVDMNATLHALCLPGTRREILDDITAWVTVPSKSANVLWLSGVAGSGKSSISTTISESFRAVDRLGAFLFFDRNDSSKSHPSAVIRTIAYKLALSNQHIGSAISDVIHRDPAVVDAPIRTQFKALLLDPLVSAEQHMQGPILIILDALDECGDPRSRAALLSLLSTEFRKLPSLFHYESASRFLEMGLDTGVPSSTGDVDLFIRHEMEDIQQRHSLGPTWPEERHIRALVTLSGGLFIWAATAIRFVNDYRPDRRLNILVAQDSTEKFNLDDLYATALRNSGPWYTDPTFVQDARVVLACVILGRVPMTDETMDMILYTGRENSADVLKYLGCVVQWSHGKEARTLHASFADYLTDPNRSGGRPWSINPKTDHRSLTLGCLRILNSDLKFNICGLEDSHVLNADVPDISRRVAEMISPQLAYSSCFWFNHVQETLIDDTILEATHGLLHYKFLYWLEALSLLGQIAFATAGLKVVADYAKERDEDLEDFVADAIKFVAGFAPAVAQSAPHIYLSALSFAPRGSRVAKQFTAWFPRTLIFQNTVGDQWPSIQKILRGHDAWVASVNFSQDGSRIVSGSNDCTLRVWDAESGALVGGPFEIGGIYDQVTSAHFSPDGSRIVTGSLDNAVCILDARSGDFVAGPLDGHTARVTSVQFSPDASRIVSGSDDHTIRVWDSQSGVLVAGPFNGHTGAVNSVDFSSDNTRIVSGSDDMTVRIWNAQTGALVSGPFEGHTSQVTSVHFSPDASRIVSGSLDNSVRVWDIYSGTLAAGPVSRHTDAVYSVDFSPDGTQIVSGSNDATVRIWDAQTGALVVGPFRGHSDGVSSVQFSPDGTRIVSGSRDKTVRVWDARPGLIVAGPLVGHTSRVTSVRFSRDGTRLVSGSEDNTVRAWDAHTGLLVAGPFEGHTSGISCIDLSLDGGRIVSGSDDSTLSVWDAHSGTTVVGPFEGPTGRVNSVHFSPNGTRIVSGSDDNKLRVWDANTGALVAGPIEGHTGLVSSVCFSSDGERIVSGSWDETVCVWDAQTGALIRIISPFDGYATDVIACVDLSPDGARIVVGAWNYFIHVWDAKTGTHVAGPFKGHTQAIDSVHFSPDGTQIVSGSWDTTIRVWDAQTGSLVAGPFEGHTERVSSVHFSADGRRIVSGSYDNTVRVWEVR